MDRRGRAQVQLSFGRESLRIHRRRDDAPATQRQRPPGRPADHPGADRLAHARRREQERRVPAHASRRFGGLGRGHVPQAGRRRRRHAVDDAGDHRTQAAAAGAHRRARGRQGGAERQVRLPRQHDPRAANAAERDRRLLGPAAAINDARGGGRPPRGADLRRQPDAAQRRQRRARLLQARRRGGGVRGLPHRPARRWRSPASTCSPARRRTRG